MAYRKLFPVRPTTPRGVVYLIHFDQPFGDARHYCGFTTNLSQRLWEHVNGTGKSSTLMRLVYEAGINWQLAKVWENVTMRDEYRIKNWGGAARSTCPICMEARRRANSNNQTTKAIQRLSAMLPPGYNIVQRPKRIKSSMERLWMITDPSGSLVAFSKRTRDLERKIRRLNVS